MIVVVMVFELWYNGPFPYLLCFTRSVPLANEQVWLGQHGMRTSHDSMGSYEWSMLLLHLSQTRRVNARMAALSMFQVVLKFIADGGLSRSDESRHARAIARQTRRYDASVQHADLYICGCRRTLHPNHAS